MKLKNVFVTLGLSLALGTGAGIASIITNNEKLAELSAAGGTMTAHTVYVAIYNNILASYTAPSVKINSNTGGSGWKQETAVNLNDTTTYSGYTVFSGHYYEDWGGMDALQFQILDGGVWKEQHQPIGSWDTSSYEGKVYFYADNAVDSKGGTWDDSYSPVTPIVYHTITKSAVEFINGVAQSPADWSLGTDEVIDGASYPVPAGVTKNLEHFVGWYTDAACTSEYEETEIEDDLTLYAKYEQLSLDSYFYWTEKDSSDLIEGSVHFWGEYQADVTIEDCLVSEVLNLKGEGHLYKIPVPSSGNIECILIHGIYQTWNIESITRGAVYYTWYDKTQDNKAYYNYVASSDMGLAADFVVEFENYREAVSETSSIKQYSICGITPANAAYIYGKYEELDSGVKSDVDASYTYTYVGKDTTVEDNILFSRIMPEIYTIALKDATFAQTHHAISISPNFINADNSALVIAVTAFVAILATGGFFFLRRRKEN